MLALLRQKSNISSMNAFLPGFDSVNSILALQSIHHKGDHRNRKHGTGFLLY